MFARGCCHWPDIDIDVKSKTVGITNNNRHKIGKDSAKIKIFF